MELLVIPSAIIMSLLYIICPVILRILINKKRVNMVLAISLSCLFVIALCVGVFTNCSVIYPVIKIVFKTNGHWASEQIYFNVFNISAFDLLVNIVMLIPVGVIFTLFYYYRNSKFSIKKLIICLLLIGLASGLFIETMQFILPIERTIQLSDVLLNTISCMLGGLYFLILLRIRKKSK